MVDNPFFLAAQNSLFPNIVSLIQKHEFASLVKVLLIYWYTFNFLYWSYIS